MMLPRRGETEMYQLILDTARGDERIRSVILNGSRANPNAPRDLFQDYDIVYLVRDFASFKQNPNWVDCFGARVIMQLPDDMLGETPVEGSYGYLIQLADGNRIDLTLNALEKLPEMQRDSLSVLLLDKDGVVTPFPPPDERDYLPAPPSAKAFEDCCNEFWWVSTYVAKGLWRREITYAKAMLEIVRTQLMQMLTWEIGARTDFSINPGKEGKYFERYLAPEHWQQLLATYADADIDHTWEALDAMGNLFRGVSLVVADHFGFAYPHQDDARVCAYLSEVRFMAPNSSIPPKMPKEKP